jgi:hypothetical protein
MPNFKPKTNKKIISNSKNLITLDNKHNELLDKFNKNEMEIIPQYKTKIAELKNKLRTEKMVITDALDIKDEIKSYKEKIKELEKEKSEYYLNNSKYIFDYFENKKEISEGQNKTTILNAFFKTKDTTNNVNDSNTLNNNLQKYMINNNVNFHDVNNYVVKTDICKRCNKGELIPVDNEGVVICNKCYVSLKYIVEHDKPSYKEPPKEVCFYAYKRINHFREILAQFQAKESTQIPEEVIENIKNQIKKERIKVENINNKKAKEILKKLGYNKYYEHIPFIKDKLGIRPPIMSPELEETLCSLFMDIQAPYSKFCPDDRVNFLNYYYTVYKLCELLNQKQFLSYFPMLKDREKRIEQDEIWKKICAELDWEFVPTI